MKYRINADDVTLPDGTVRTEADYERMALEAETTEPDYVFKPITGLTTRTEGAGFERPGVMAGRVGLDVSVICGS